MKKIKIIVGIFLGLIIVLVVTALILLRVYKDEILTMIKTNVKENYGLNLKIENLRISFFSNWPHATIELRNVEMSSTLNGGEKEPFLNAGSLYLSFNLRKLLSKQFRVKDIAVKNVKIMLRKKKDGSTNFEFKPQKQDTLETEKKESKLDFDIKSVSLKNAGFTFVNEQRLQRLNFTFINTSIYFQKKEEGFVAQMRGSLHIGALLFKLKKGPFFKNAMVDLNLDVIWLKAIKRLTIAPPSYITIEKVEYKTTCSMDFGEKKRIVIMANCDKANVYKASKLLNYKLQKILSNFHIDNPVQADVLIGLKLGVKQDPIVLVKVQSERNSLELGSSKIPYKDISFRLRVISITKDMEAGDEDHGKILVENLKGKIFDFPFTGTVALTGFQNAYLDAKANVLLEGDKVQFNLAKKFTLKGQCLAHLELSGPSEKMNKKEFLGPEMNIKASLHFKDFSMQSKKSPFYYGLKGKASLDKQDLSFKNLAFKTNGGVTLLNGKAQNFTSYVLGIENSMKVDLDANTAKFDLNPYFVKTEVESRTQVKDAMQRVKDKSKPVEKKKLEIEDDKLNIHLRVFAKSLLVKKVEATNSEILMDYYDNTLFLRSVNLNVCNGKLTASGQVDDLKKLKAQLNIEGVDVSLLFKQMDNFGMDALKSDNLQGNLKLSANYEAELDETKSIIPASMQADVKLNLTDGHLLNFEPMQKISNYIFKNRDFKDISFTEISENFHVKGYAMKIEEMEVASNVINMYVSGVYNMKGNSTVNVLIPWSNLKHRDKDYEAKSLGESAEDVKGLKLNFSGEPKKMKLKPGYKKVDF